MKQIAHLLLTLLITSLYSCSTIDRSTREAFAIARFDKSEFDYSQQVEGEINITKVLGIDWQHLLNKERGKVAKSYCSFIYGTLPNSKGERLALYQLMQNNPGYDFIVYPQYEVRTQALGLGLFYKKIKIKAKARLAVSNEIYAQKGASNDNAKYELELINHLKELQNAYDVLLRDIEEIKHPIAPSTEEFKRKIRNAEDAALEAERKAFNAKLEQEDLTAALDADISNFSEDASPRKQTKPTSTKQPAPKEQSTIIEASPAPAKQTTSVSTSRPVPSELNEVTSVNNTEPDKDAKRTTRETLPPSSSIQMGTIAPPAEVEVVQSKDYILVLASFNNYEKAVLAQQQLEQKYKRYRKTIGIIKANNNYRIGFLNFATREDAIDFRTRLKQRYPECKDAWPFRAQ